MANISFLISNSVPFAELVEALKRAISCPARALASPQLKHRQKSCLVPAGGCWKYKENGPYSTSAEIHKKRFCLLCPKYPPLWYLPLFFNAQIALLRPYLPWYLRHVIVCI
jgi:hypothetical protein